MNEFYENVKDINEDDIGELNKMQLIISKMNK